MLPVIVLKRLEAENRRRKFGSLKIRWAVTVLLVFNLTKFAPFTCLRSGDGSRAKFTFRGVRLQL